MYFNSSSFKSIHKHNLPKFIQKPISIEIALNRFLAENNLNVNLFDNCIEASPSRTYDILEKVLVHCHKKAFFAQTVRFNKKNIILKIG